MNVHTQSGPIAQRGAVLLIMMLLLLVGGSALLVNVLTSRSAQMQNIVDYADALAEAKAALIAYAVTRHDLNQAVGLLPCPDINNGGGFAEGDAHVTGCGAQYVSTMGRLPWKTLGLNPTRDSIGECLWYAVSGAHKDAATARSEMLNADSTGLLQVFATDGVTPIAGITPADRAVAVIVAPGDAQPGQTRTVLGSGVDQCSGNYTAARYLDNAGAINNATLSGAPNTIDQFINQAANSNDQLLVITRGELENAINARSDLHTDLIALTDAVAECIANYGATNPGGATDLRLPWPAPLDLVDYRVNGQYNDTATGILSGRLADTVNDSNGQTGNTIARVLQDCNTAAVPAWTAAMQAFWMDWKDHLFYAVADDFRPDAPLPTSCANCLTVNGAGNWAAVVLFAGARLPAMAQVRDEPPTDTDTRNVIGNYLEGRNASNHPLFAGTADYESAAAGPTFNDVLRCIDATLSVSVC